jgi:hypothetical protein
MPARRRAIVNDPEKSALEIDFGIDRAKHDLQSVPASPLMTGVNPIANLLPSLSRPVHFCR